MNSTFDLEAIEELVPETLSTELIAALGQQLVQSDEPIVRNTIAAKFNESQNPLCLPYLIDGIKVNLNSSHVGQLVSACEGFDCSPYLQVFVDTILLKTNLVLYDALLVVRENIHSLSSEIDGLFAIQKLELFLTTVTVYYPFKREVEEVIQHIKHLVKTELSK